MHPPSTGGGRGPNVTTDSDQADPRHPAKLRLSLLPSGPDEVHASPLRGTRSSTSIIPPASAHAGLGREFSPAGADCRYRAPLAPRLARHADSTSVTTQIRIGDRLDPTGSGGEGGIRTHDGLPHTAFPVPRPRPLGDLSGGGNGSIGEWRRGWDSNLRCFRTPLFESGTINHSDTSPNGDSSKPMAGAMGYGIR